MLRPALKLPVVLVSFILLSELMPIGFAGTKAVQHKLEDCDAKTVEPTAFHFAFLKYSITVPP